jgi:hypothetical protein
MVVVMVFMVVVMVFMVVGNGEEAGVRLPISGYRVADLIPPRKR